MRIAGLVLLVACGGSEPARSSSGSPVRTSGVSTAQVPDAASPVDDQDSAGWTPLMHAAQMGDVDEMKDLLARGANIDANSDTIYNGSTPLLIALQFSEAEAAMLLIERGASIAGSIGPLAIALAARNGDMVLVEYLLVHGVAASGYAVTLAAMFDHGDVITRLVQAGAPVNDVDTDDHDYTPLIVACQKNQANAVAALLKAGAQVDAVDDDGSSALHWAVYGAAPVETHVYREIDQPHDTYWVPQRDAPVVKLLVDAKAKLDLRNQEGNTALHDAAMFDAAAAAQVLVDGGASRKIANNHGYTAYDIARQRKNSVRAVLAPTTP
jgi:ankyrin repeat protein